MIEGHDLDCWLGAVKFWENQQNYYRNLSEHERLQAKLEGSDTNRQECVEAYLRYKEKSQIVGSMLSSLATDVRVSNHLRVNNKCEACKRLKHETK